MSSNVALLTLNKNVLTILGWLKPFIGRVKSEVSEEFNTPVYTFTCGKLVVRLVGYHTIDSGVFEYPFTDNIVKSTQRIWIEFYLNGKNMATAPYESKISIKLNCGHRIKSSYKNYILKCFTTCRREEWHKRVDLIIRNGLSILVYGTMTNVAPNEVTMGVGTAEKCLD